MAWDDVLAGIGGAAAGADNAMRFYGQLDAKREQAALRQIISVLQEQGRNDRATQSSGDKRYGIDTTAAAKDADRQQRDAHYASQHDDFMTSLDQAGTLATMRDATTQRGQDQTDARFWGGTDARGWAGQDLQRYGIDTGATTARRGQDVGATTARRGQDMSQSTAQRGQDLTANTSQANAATAATAAGARNRAGTLMDLLRLRQRDQQLTLPDDPTNWADEFDKLWNDPTQATQEALGHVPAPGPATPAPGMPPPAPSPMSGPRLPVPVAPRPGAAPATPTTAAPPAGLRVGATVKLKNGQRVTVTRINPDGTFEYR